MQPIRTFNVTPALPPRLEPLRQLAYNLHWDWNVDTKDLFRRLDRDLWESSRHNPVLMLGTISQTRLQEVSEDEGFIAQMERAAQQLEDYHHRLTWYHKQRKGVGGRVSGLREEDDSSQSPIQNPKSSPASQAPRNMQSRIGVPPAAPLKPCRKSITVQGATTSYLA